jgi:carbonic anhydrase
MKCSRFLPSGRSKRFLSSGDSDYFNRPGIWDDKNLGTLLDANKAWKQRMVHQQPDFFKEIKKGHAPKILWIGCSDARVPANEIIGEPPGSVFIHRNIANMVVNTDFNVMSVIQFAVTVLKVKHIIVCGHYDCGGIKASLTTNDYASPLCNWLRNIRDTYRLHRDELNRIEDMRLRQRRLVELNVVEQVSKIFLNFFILKIYIFSLLSVEIVSNSLNSFYYISVLIS